MLLRRELLGGFNVTTSAGLVLLGGVLLRLVIVFGGEPVMMRNTSACVVDRAVQYRKAIDFILRYETIGRMISRHMKRRKSLLASVVSYVLVVSFGILFFSPEYSFSGMIGHARINPPENIATKINNAPKYRADLALNKSAGNFSFVYSFSLLKFDFKQNLHTWPVLATRTGRSPPLA